MDSHLVKLNCSKSGKTREKADKVAFPRGGAGVEHLGMGRPFGTGSAPRSRKKEEGRRKLTAPRCGSSGPGTPCESR